MALHVSLTAVLLAAVAALVWKGAGHRWWFAALALLAGFYLARTGAAPAIDHATASVAGLLDRIHL